MKLTDLENELMKLESPYAIGFRKLKKFKEELGGSADRLYDIYKDKYRVSALIQLFVCDKGAANKLFMEKDVQENTPDEIIVGGKIYSSPYILPEIPNGTIIYYSRFVNYEKAPETKLQLYNDISRFSNKDISREFLRNILMSPDLDIGLLFGSDVYEHLSLNHVSTEREKVSRVLLEQKPGTSIVSIDIPTEKEYVDITGKPFDEEEYYEYLNELYEEADNKINDEKIQEYIKEAIRENIEDILFWYESWDHSLFESKGADANEISIKYDISKSPYYEGTPENPEYIGSGYDLMLREKYTTILKIPLRKDKFSPLGINAKTLYPDILDKNSIYSGKTFDLEEAFSIGRDVAINTSIKKASAKKIEQMTQEIQEKANRPLTAVEKDLISESEAVALSGEEIHTIIDKVDATYQGVEYFKSPMYQAFAQIKEEFTDKKIVTFFGNFREKQRIEITPETFENRKNSEFHRCVIVRYNNADSLHISYFKTARAAGFNEPEKIQFDDLTDDEKSIFKYCIKVTKSKLKEFKKENTVKSEEEKLVDSILNGPPQIQPNSQVQDIER